MEQIVKQLYKLVHIVKVTEHTAADTVQREIMLLKVNAESGRRGEILDAANLFEATAVDVGAATITFELAGEPARLADFLELMRTYGIVSLVKSGRIAMARDAKGTTRKQRLKSA
jgi:acetolactate synthase-1/3 small subunit